MTRLAIGPNAAMKWLVDFTTRIFRVSVPQGGVVAIGRTWDSSGAVKGDYLVALLATVGGRTINLAQDTFKLLEPIKLGIDQGFARSGRVLVLVACDNSQNNGQVAACLAGRTALVDSYLTTLGIEHKIVTDVTSFTKEFRCGRYNTYWLSGSADQLDADLATSAPPTPPSDTQRSARRRPSPRRGRHGRLLRAR